MWPVKLGSDMSKNEIRFLTLTSLKTHLQMVQELQQVIPESGSGTRKGYTWSHWYRKGFLERTLIELVLSVAINKWDLKKSKCFCTTKDIIILMKGQSTKLKMSTMYTSDYWSLSRIYKELTSEIIKKENKTKNGA